MKDSDSSHHVAKKLILAKATTMEVTAKVTNNLLQRCSWQYTHHSLFCFM